MSQFIMCHTFKDNAYVEISGKAVKFWEGEGLPSYEGSLDGFARQHPDYLSALVEAKILKAV